MDKKFTVEIFQPNIITYANQNATATQKNIIYKVFEHLNQYQSKKTGLNKDLFNNLIVSFNIKTVSKDTDYQKPYEAAKSLMRGYFEYEYNKDKKRHIEAVVPFVSTKHEYGSKTIEITINKDALPILLHLSKNYTALQASVAFGLKSVYSKKIYELCSRWKDKGGFVITENELRAILGLQTKYARTHDFKKRVLEVAKKELEKTADIWFEYDFKNKNKPIFFKLFYREKIPKITAVDKPGLYTKVFRYLQYAFPQEKNGDAKFICDRLIDINEIERFEKSLRNYFYKCVSGEITEVEMKKLTYSILRDDYGIIKKKGQIKFI